MKDNKKTTKKTVQSSSGLTIAEGDSNPAQETKAAEAAPTLVAESDQPAKKSKQKRAPAKPEKNSKPPKMGKGAKEEKKSLNFKVSADFRREFKTYASAHDLKLSKLLELAFEGFRKQQGD